MIVRVPALRIAALGAALLGVAGVGARAAGVRSRPATRRHGGARRSGNVTGTLQRISVGISGEGFGDSKAPAFSADGRYQVFASAAELADNDFNGVYDIYLRDRLTGVLEYVSFGNPLFQGGPYELADDDSFSPSVSDDGRFVAFNSNATNIISADTNGFTDVFVRDRRHDSIRASVSSVGVQSNGNSGGAQISGNGQYVAYWSDATNLVSGDANKFRDIFVTRIALQSGGTGATSGLQVLGTGRISVASGGAEADGDSTNPSISSDGRFVAFESKATNLVPNDTNGKSDIFVKDLQTGTVELISQADDGTRGDGDSFAPKISADGNFVVYVSDATNLVSDDTNGVRDVFIYDRSTQTTERVSVADDGTEGDLASGEPLDDTPAAAPDVTSARPGVTTDGRYVIFSSEATTLVPGETSGKNQIFIRDRVASTTTEVSTSDAGVEGDEDSFFSTISADGSTIGFSSQADNLVLNDKNAVEDVFVKVIGASAGINQPPDVIVAPVPDAVEGDLITLDASATSDPEGDTLTFHWTQNVSPGDPVVTLADPTAAITTFTAPPVIDPVTLEFDVSVSDGVNPAQIGSVFVTIGIAPPGVIEGQVTDTGGNPVAGAMISVVRNADGAASQTVFTDGAGFYEVTDARVGDDTITAISSGFEPVSQDVSVDAGSTNLLDIQFAAQTAQILGLVSYSDGSPVVGATVDLIGNSGGQATVLATTQTESDGSYVLDDVDHTEIQAATAIRISSPGLIQWTDATGGLTPSAVNHRDYRYGRLQVTIDAKPNKLRKLLDNSPVQLSNLIDSNGDVPTIVADKKTRKVFFPNVPAVSVKVKVTNPSLTGAQSTVQVRSGSITTKLTLTLKPRGTF